MSNKLTLIILALIVTLGVGIGIAVAQALNHDDDQYVALRAYLANSGCPYVGVDGNGQDATAWFAPVPGTTPTPGQYYQTTTHTFELANLYPGFGYYYFPGASPCDDPSYILYFVRNEDQDDPSKIGPITVTTYTLDESLNKVIPCPWLQITRYDDPEWNIKPDIKADVESKIDALPTSDGVKAAMKTAFLRGCIKEGDTLERADLGESDPSTWGCYGISIRVPFEDVDGEIPQGEPAYITITIEPQGENMPAIYFMNSSDLNNE